MINATEVKFLGLILDDTLNWKKHIEQLVNKMSSACYALRNLRPLLSQDTLKTVYYACLHSLLSYGIICWGGSSQAKKIFILQKKSIKIVTNSKTTDSCRKHFKRLKIMTVYTQYIYSVIMHTINNKHLYKPNKEIHKYETRNMNDLH
jgi:hypothetical protein